MRRIAIAPCIVLCLALALAASPAAAQVEGPLAWSDDPKALAGWKQVGEGLWTRTLADGTVETEAFGRAGLVQVLEQLDTEMVRLVETYLLDPTDEMAKVLETHLAIIQRLEADLAAGAGRPPSEPAATDCSTSWSANAGGLSSCGNFANASSSYFGTSASACFGLCDLSSWAYVERRVCNGTLFTASQSCFKPDVINQTCSSSVSLSQNGLLGCFASAYASIYCPDINWFRSASQTSAACGSGCLFCAQEEEF